MERESKGIIFKHMYRVGRRRAQGRGGSTYGTNLVAASTCNAKGERRGYRRRKGKGIIETIGSI